MKGFGHLVLFTFFYLLLIIVIRDVVGEPRGVIFPTEPIDEPSGGPCFGPNCPSSEIHNGSNQNTQKSSLNQSVFSGTNKGFVESNVSNIDKEFFADSSSNVPPEQVTFPKQRAQAQQPAPTPQNSNGTNPLVQMFDVSDPDTKGILDTVYGTYAGNDQCTRKAFCVMGNYMLETPGKDLIFMVMGRYVPPEYNIYYDIFRNSALYGQNCNVYICALVNPSSESSTSSPLTGLNNPPVIKTKE